MRTLHDTETTCHCGANYRGSDHCPQCGCEQYESLHCDMTPQARLEYLRGQIEAECISYGEIFELQCLANHIEPGDTTLLEWAGVSEFSE